MLLPSKTNADHVLRHSNILYIIREWCVKPSIVIIQFYFFLWSESKTLKFMYSRLSLSRPILSGATLQNHFPNSIYLLYVILFGIYCLWISHKQISIIYIPIRIHSHCRVCSTLIHHLLPKNIWSSQLSLNFKKPSKRISQFSETAVGNCRYWCRGVMPTIELDR